MTLSNSNSSYLPSAAVDLVNDADNTDDNNYQSSNNDYQTDTVGSSELAANALIDNIENLDTQDFESSQSKKAELKELESDLSASTIASKGKTSAAFPEPKITMQALSEDVVIASIEQDLPESATSTIEDEFTEDTLADGEANTTLSGSDKDRDNLINNQGSTEDLAENQEFTEAQPETKLEIQQPDNVDLQNLQIKQRETEHSEESFAEEEEEPKEKEAKLESYKQFVAEQFSNQKVDYPEVRVRIEANALPSKMYFIMNVLSAIIASYGLVTNSAAVVIGAMLVAMMLGPITGVALAVIDHRMPLLQKSLFTVLAGVSLVVIVGFMVGWLHNDQPLTAEILSRTQPTSMDLMIALAGGTAGAYAMVSPHLSVAVVGVAVATALVPPLAASGILFANGEMQLGLGALLLAITNIIAIQFTNALVLWLLGFRRLVDDDYKSNTFLTFCRRNIVTLILLGVLGSYLSINLQTNAKQQTFESSVKETINSYFLDKGNVLTNTQFDTADENKVVRAIIRGETTPSSYDVRQIEAIITKNMATNFPDYLPIKLQLRYLPVQVIEANPLVTDKLDKTDAAILTN